VIGFHKLCEISRVVEELSAFKSSTPFHKVGLLAAVDVGTWNYLFPVADAHIWISSPSGNKVFLSLSRERPSHPIADGRNTRKLSDGIREGTVFHKVFKKCKP